MVTVKYVESGSLAQKAGILPEDIIISINGEDINDVLDYDFYTANKEITLKIHRGAELFDVKIKKDQYENIGLEFDTYLMSNKRSCKNKCIFCFIDQLPKNMRETLYFKDDDCRLSFLQGNYITLTNLEDRDIERIIKMRLMPVNISVHTTDKELRCKMMNNRFAGEKLKYLDMLYEGKVRMNGQIVLCKGVNDGESLKKTLCDLERYFPYMESVSIVPAGLTKHRDGLYPLEPFTADEAKAVIQTVENFAEECYKKHKSHIFYCSDEFYLRAKLPLKEGRYFEGFCQIENGVGMIPSMRDEFFDELPFVEESEEEISLSIATGYAAYDFICSLVEKLKEKYKNLKCNVYKIENKFFGENITVAGLVTGKDLIEQLKGKELYTRLLVPENMLNYNGEMFLCSTTLEEVKNALGVEIEPCEITGYGFINKVLNIKE